MFAVNLASVFSRRVTYLLCSSGTGLIFEKACQWGIVNVLWLVKMVESGQIPGLDGFLVSTSQPGNDIFWHSVSTLSWSASRLTLFKIDHETWLKHCKKLYQRVKEETDSRRGRLSWRNWYSKWATIDQRLADSIKTPPWKSNHWRSILCSPTRDKDRMPIPIW